MFLYDHAGGVLNQWTMFGTIFISKLHLFNVYCCCVNQHYSQHTLLFNTLLRSGCHGKCQRVTFSTCSVSQEHIAYCHWCLVIRLYTLYISRKTFQALTNFWCRLYRTELVRIVLQMYTHNFICCMCMCVLSRMLFTTLTFVNNFVKVTDSPLARLYCSYVLFMVLLMFHHPTPTGA